MSARPKVPKSYINVVKPAAFAKVSGSAAHSSGATIKLKVNICTTSHSIQCLHELSKYPLKFLFQFNSASLAKQRSWGAQTDVLDVEAFIGLAEMPTEDFT